MVSKGRKASKQPPPKPRPVVVYFEGGGDSANNKALMIEAQHAMSTLLRRGAGREVRTRACGGRQQAYDKFCAECALAAGRPVLLVDAEEAVADIARPWAHLQARDRWERPSNATDEDAFLMVQTMEAWLLSDPSALGEALGKGFKAEKIPKWPALEKVSKSVLYETLGQASRACERPYDKGKHSFEALAKIDVERLKKACGSAARLFDVLPRLK
jgi:hypothetical protein